MKRRSIFVTGAASGIGRETARLFAQRRWFVGLFDLNDNTLAALASEFGAEHCCWQKLDVTDAENFQRAVTLFAERTGGTMDLLFNCAGVTFNGKLADVPLPRLQQIIRINVEGVLIGTHLSLPLLRRTPNSHIVNMASASALYGVPEMAAYSASKAAVRGLTEALNLELEADGIVVSDILPSFVNTPMVTAQTCEVRSVKNLGVKLQAEDVASGVWRAAHGRKVHWIPEWRIRLMNAFTRCWPRLQRSVMKWIFK